MNINEYAGRVALLTGGKIVFDKRNGVKLIGVEKKIEGTRIGRIFWMNYFMEENKTPEWTAGYITALEEKIAELPFEEVNVEDREKAVRILRARLRHVETKPEICRSAEEYGFYDLVIEPYLQIGMKDGSTVAAVISAKLLDIWHITPKEVIDRAISNSRKDVELIPLKELLDGMDDLKMLYGLENPPEMIIVTTKQRYNGAIAALFTDKQLKEYYGSGYTLLPSSIHEMMAINRRGDGLDDLVLSMNQKEVSPMERLSDHAYHMW